MYFAHQHFLLGKSSQKSLKLLLILENFTNTFKIISSDKVLTRKMYASILWRSIIDIRLSVRMLGMYFIMDYKSHDNGTCEQQFSVII